MLCVVGVLCGVSCVVWVLLGVRVSCGMVVGVVCYVVACECV